MMQMRDWISGLIGSVILLIGLTSFWEKISFIDLPVSVLRWIVFVGGLYLAWNSIIEITNSNIVGWWSFGAAAASIVIGALPFFGLGLFSKTFYDVVLVVVGVFLMIATFAMEL